MAGTAGRVLLVSAWVVVLGGLAGGAGYLHSLGPPPGPPDLSQPEAAPAPEAPPRLDAAPAAPESPVSESPVSESPVSESPVPVSPAPDGADAAPAGPVDAGDAPPATAVAEAPRLPSLAESMGEANARTASQPEVESLQTLADQVGEAAPARSLADPQPSLAELTLGADAAEAERFEPDTQWPVRTPELHGPMPMIARQAIDLAMLADAPAQSADDNVMREAAPPEPVPPQEAAPALEAAPDAPEVAVLEAPELDEPAEEPVAVPVAAPEPAPDAPAPPEAATPEAATPEAATPDVPPAEVAAAPGIADSVETPAERGLSATPDDRVVESTEVGPLPVVSSTGVRAADVYAHPFDVSGNRPMVAVVVSGLGLSSGATEAAIQSLPGAVTLSFSPYSSRLQDWVALARAAGHEVLIDLPMEPADFPNSDPGPQALMTGLSPEVNLQRLEWVLSRTTNYVGVGSFMGSRFAADAAAMRPVLEAIRARGLIYLDNGEAIGNVATALSG
ncbi:MAG: divergent polysaccharide deacetylase family protein, partial [Alphaproteobacteria bacterium]